MKRGLVAVLLLPLHASIACEPDARDARAPVPTAARTASPLPLPPPLPPPAASAAPATSAATPASATTAATPPSAPPCDGPDQRRYGTACCNIPEGHGHRIPGQAILRCHGPRIGKPCTRKGDCDIACFCNGNQSGPQPSSDSGPASGATGLTGVCGGTLWAGAWMCQIDEAGKVTRIIID